ncbi:winged helix-turn-helix domain-containing protein [Methanoregula sp.]|jgi:DNA-binding transcriptional ArsR family regulator|uniref:winged helix-turn-helix domain-containing protein n=1 Tax=Methanoregula sp. TaxID=2052170 RepID=UPI0025F0AE4E|nr:winged helix-turn-helix domain-containing protein [Methanoregula sp.]
MYGIEFVMTDLEEEVKFTRQSISRALKKFSERGMITIRKEGRTWYYSINENSSLVQRIEDFHNSLVESIVGEEKIREFEDKYEKSVRASVSSTPKQSIKKVVFRHDTSGEIASGVAERSRNLPERYGQ